MSLADVWLGPKIGPSGRGFCWWDRAYRLRLLRPFADWLFRRHTDFYRAEHPHRS